MLIIVYADVNTKKIICILRFFSILKFVKTKYVVVPTCVFILYDLAACKPPEQSYVIVLWLPNQKLQIIVASDEDNIRLLYPYCKHNVTNYVTVHTYNTGTMFSA